jgi:hypothetical protein
MDLEDKGIAMNILLMLALMWITPSYGGGNITVSSDWTSLYKKSFN